MIANTEQIKVSSISKLDTFEKKRDCYTEIKDFINSHKGTKGQICALYGLRRTGKTVLMTQVAKELEQSGHKCLYLVCSDEYDNIRKDRENNLKHIPQIKELYEILDKAIAQNYEYVFIDELTFIKDFVGQGNVISNYYANQGLNIIATGTDSLCFNLVAQDDMLDRIKMIRTSYVPYEEYNRLLGKDIDEYIKYGGTLAEESPYKDNSSTIRYTNSAIVKNIIHSIRSSEHNNPRAITLLYSEEDIASTINRCINQMNQAFLVSAINRNSGIYESHPLHLGLSNAKNFPYAEYIDVLSVDGQVKESLSILNKDEMSVELRQTDIDVIRDALKELDLVLTIPAYLSIKESSTVQDQDSYILSQAGMIYCHATELLKILTKEENWEKLEKCGAENKDLFVRRIDRQVKGDILENLILYDTYKALNSSYIVTKLRQKRTGKEIDLVVSDRITKDTYLFEVKYADYVDEYHQKNLSDIQFMEYIQENFGHIQGRHILYTGVAETVEDSFGSIEYISADRYLKNVMHCRTIQELLEKCKISGKTE